jgi:hypothetical protein
MSEWVNSGPVKSLVNEFFEPEYCRTGKSYSYYEIDGFFKQPI